MNSSEPREIPKKQYYPETDSLYIDLFHRTSVESREISEGVVLDYDAYMDTTTGTIGPACAGPRTSSLMCSRRALNWPLART